MVFPTLRVATLDDVDFLAEVMYVASVPPPSVGVDHPDAASWVEGVRKASTEQVLGKVEDSTTYVIVVDGERVGRLVPLVLQVSKDNPDAERLYTRLGFRRDGEEGDEYWMTADPAATL